MPKKSTTNLENELKSCDTLESFLKRNLDELSTASLAEQLLNEVYAYQIISGARRPSRDKLLCLCIAMKATLDETRELLVRGGFAPLYVRSQRDSIIIFAISHGETILELNNNMYDHGEPLLE